MILEILSPNVLLAVMIVVVSVVVLVMLIESEFADRRYKELEAGFWILWGLLPTEPRQVLESDLPPEAVRGGE